MFFVNMAPESKTKSPSQDKTLQNTVIKKTSPEEIRNILLKDIKMESDPKYLLSLAAKALDDYRAADASKEEESKANVTKRLQEAYSIVALETHHLLADSVAEKYSPLASELSNQLNQEYNCRTP